MLTQKKVAYVVKHKHLLMLVHALTNFEAGDNISSMALSFHEFAQTFELFCALSFSHPKYLPSSGVEESLYFEQFGKGHSDDDCFKNVGCFKTVLVALSHLSLYISPGEFTCVGDGELVTIPEKENTKSYLLEFLRHRQTPQISLENVASLSWNDFIVMCHLFLECHPSS